MTVWIVVRDSGDKYGPGSWDVEKVFETEADARAFADADINREVQAHEVMQPTRCSGGRHIFRHATRECDCGEVQLNREIDIQP